jgi:hypothetical protein
MKPLIILFAAAAFACGGTDTTTTSVNGTVGGVSLGSIVDAQALVVTNGSCDNSHPTGNLLVIDLSSTAGVCSAVNANKDTPNSTTLGILVTSVWVAPAGSTTTPDASPAFELNKAYPINGNLDTVPRDSNGFGVAVTAGFNSTDATCTSKLANNTRSATGGSVTLTGVSSSGVSGTFSLTFATGTLTGSFSTGSCGFTTAQVCALLANQAPSTCG